MPGVTVLSPVMLSHRPRPPTTMASPDTVYRVPGVVLVCVGFLASDRCHA